MSDGPWLPELLPWVGAQDGEADPSYLDRVYEVYERDFITSRPLFRGLEVVPKRHPEYNGRCGTFWHIMSQTVGTGRLIRPNRCERIQWVRPMIEAVSVDGRVAAYPVLHPANEVRWEIALHDFSYIVVVAERSGYFALWTAFEQETEKRRRKARAKHEAWLASRKKLKPPSR